MHFVGCVYIVDLNKARNIELLKYIILVNTEIHYVGYVYIVDLNKANNIEHFKIYDSRKH